MRLNGLYIAWEGKTIAFGLAMRIKRGERTIREAAKEARLEVSTYFRTEKGKLPDVPTCIRVIKWLGLPASSLEWEP
jgi:hypothetical protein